MSSRCGMQDYAAEFMYLQVGQRCEAVLKFFDKTKKKQKNKKKMLFFASHESRRQSRFAREKYSFRREAEKRKIFPEATRRA